MKLGTDVVQHAARVNRLRLALRLRPGLRFWLLCVILSVVLVLAIILSVALGAVSVPFTHVIRIIFGHLVSGTISWDQTDRRSGRWCVSFSLAAISGRSGGCARPWRSLLWHSFSWHIGKDGQKETRSPPAPSAKERPLASLEASPLAARLKPGHDWWLAVQDSIFYIGSILVPILFTLNARQRASVLAQGLPAFSALAIVTVILLATTGSLNTTVHLTQLSQFLTTLYGQTLLVKIGLFLLMIVISAFHSFVLRPRLGLLLAQHQQTQAATIATGASAHLSRSQEKRAGAASFGTNTFTVTLQDAHSHSLPGAAVLLETTMLDMDMGTQNTQLQAVPAKPGTYQGQGDLAMAGRWAVTIRVLPPNANTFVQYRFPFSAEEASLRTHGKKGESWSHCA